MSLISEHFGNDLLFFCIKFRETFKEKPRKYVELFEWMRFSKTEAIIKETLMEMVKAKAGYGR